MKRLTKERLKRNLTQTEVAELVGSTKQAVCNWEKGRNFPKYEVLIELENLFKLSHQELFSNIPDE